MQFLNCCHHYFFNYILLFILFKIFVQIYKIVSHVLIFFSDKINYNKIYVILKKIR
jgi:hypothetical protein